MQVSHLHLMLGRLSMERFARRRAEAPARSISIEGCTLHSAGGEDSIHTMEDVARYMQRVYGHLVTVRLNEVRSSCLIEKV